MKVMSLSFLAGLAVAWFERRALWLVAIMALTALSLIAVKSGWPDLSRARIGAVAHLALWPFALAALWWRSSAPLHRVFRLWRLWVSGLIAVSLSLDLAALIG